MLTKSKLFFLLGIAQVSIGFAAVKSPEVNFFSIDEIVNTALINNPELKSTEADLEFARGNRTQAGLWKNPDLSVQYGERRVRDLQGNLLEKGTTRSASIAFTFEFPGKGSLRKAIAEKDIQLAELGLEQFRLSLEDKVRLLAYKYIATVEKSRAAQEISDRTTALVTLLHQRAIPGVQGLLDIRIIEGSLIDLQRSAREFEQERVESLSEINVLLGRKANEPLNIHGILKTAKLSQNLNELTQTAIENNLQLRMRRIELQKATQSVTAAKLDAAPDFNIGPFFSLDHAGTSDLNAGISVTMPLPLWNWNQGNIEAAKGKKEQAEALWEQSQRSIQIELSRRFSAHQLTLIQLDHSSMETLNQLKEAAQLADRHYRLGSINVQTYLEMERQYLSSTQTIYDAIIESYASLFDLELLIGRKLTVDSSKESFK